MEMISPKSLLYRESVNCFSIYPPFATQLSFLVFFFFFLMPTNECASSDARHSSRSRLAIHDLRITGERFQTFSSVNTKKNFLNFLFCFMGAVYVERPYSILISTGSNTATTRGGEKIKTKGRQTGGNCYRSNFSQT